MRAGHLPTLLASWLHFESSFLLWMLMGGLAVVITSDLHLSPIQQGLLVGVPLLGGALWRVPVGLLGDRYGMKRVGTVILLAAAVPLALAWQVAADLPGLLLVGLLLGIAGASFAVALPLAGHTYPARYQGTVMGIAAAGNSGVVLAALMAPRLAEAVGWRATFGLFIIPAILVAIGFALVARESPRGAAIARRSTLALFRQGDLWWFSILYTMTFGGWAGLASFLGLYFHNEHGMDPVAAGVLVSVCVVAGSLLRPLGGFVADRKGGVWVLSVVYMTVPLALVAPIAGAPLAITATSLLCGMALLGLGNGAVFQLVPRRFPGQRGLAVGVVGAAGGIGGFLLPTLFGLQRELTGSYSSAFLSYALSLAYMFLCVRALHVGWRFTWLSPNAPRTEFQGAEA